MTRERRRRTAKRNVRILEPAKCDNVSLVVSTAAPSIIHLRHNGSRRRFALAMAQNAPTTMRHDKCHALRNLPHSRHIAVELATCPRQCVVALQSNFCRHTNRMVNPQATFSHLHGRRLQSAHWGRVRARFHNDASPCRCDRFAIEPVRGFVRVFNFRGQNMKQLLLAGVAAVSVAGAASAADMQARPYKAPPPAAMISPAYNWSGFYIGAMGGYGWDDGNATAALAVVPSATTGNSPAASSSSVSKWMPPAPASRTVSPPTSAEASWPRRTSRSRPSAA